MGRSSDSACTPFSPSCTYGTYGTYVRTAYGRLLHGSRRYGWRHTVRPTGPRVKFFITVRRAVRDQKFQFLNSASPAPSVPHATACAHRLSSRWEISPYRPIGSRRSFTPTGGMPVAQVNECPVSIPVARHSPPTCFAGTTVGIGTFHPLCQIAVGEPGLGCGRGRELERGGAVWE